jgi:hypothetical protein
MIRLPPWGSPRGRADERDSLALVAPVDAKVLPVCRGDAVTRVELAHPNQAQVGEIGLTVCIPLRQRRQVREVLTAVECQPL